MTEILLKVALSTHARNHGIEMREPVTAVLGNKMNIIDKKINFLSYFFERLSIICKCSEKKINTKYFSHAPNFQKKKNLKNKVISN